MYQTVDVQPCHADGDDVLEDRFHPAPDLQAFAGIGFLHELVPAPADPVAAEQGEDEGAYGQQVGTCRKRLPKK